MNKQKLISAAQESELPELVLKNGRILNVFTGEIISGDVAVTDGCIVGLGKYRGKTEKDVGGRYIVPGFVNAHVHVESSMVTPEVYSFEELRHGTTTIITDPHEIVNVGGADALADIISAAERSPLNYYVMLPSCVPSTPFEHGGAKLLAADLKPFKSHPLVLGLGEMMDSVGVIEKNSDVIEKLDEFSDMIIDGHAPMMTGKALNAYACGGIDTDHESIAYEEAVEKLRCGIAVLVREGSASKNLRAVIRGVLSNNIDTTRLAFCTDDKHLADIRREGTIRHNIEKSISLGLSPVKAYQMATINAARIYGLKRTGAVACGYKADIVVLDDFETVSIHEVYKDGVLFSEIKPSLTRSYNSFDSLLHPLRSVNTAPLPENAFYIPPQVEYSVIGIIKHQIATLHLRRTHQEIYEGLKKGSIRKIAVNARHHATN